MAVRHRLAQLIDQRGMTQTAVAERIGEAVTWINNRIHGVSAIKADELPRLAQALGVPISAFFEVEPPSPTHAGEPVHTYADAFVRSLARAWQQDMAEPEREFIEATATAMRRYREELLSGRQ